MASLPLGWPWPAPRVWIPVGGRAALAVPPRGVPAPAASPQGGSVQLRCIRAAGVCPRARPGACSELIASYGGSSYKVTYRSSGSSPPAVGKDTFSSTRLLRVPSSLSLSTSRDRAATSSLGSLSQCYTTLMLTWVCADQHRHIQVLRVSYQEIKCPFSFKYQGGGTSR